MSRVKLGFTVVCAALFLTFSSGADAADTGNLKAAADNKSAETSRHYDPSHPGHEHQCNGCRRTYHQQGDNGPYSSGSNICPYCGYVNPVPPSPTPEPYPPAPYPPAPYPPAPYPPTPYPPAPYPVPGGMTTGQLLQMANAAPTYEQMDRLLIENVRFVTDLTVDNLFSLYNKARTYESGDMILLNAVSSHGFYCTGLMSIWNKARTYENGDRALISGVAMMMDMSVENVFNLWNKAHSYTNADQILLVSMPRLGTQDLYRLKNKARYSSTVQAIDYEIRRRQGYSRQTAPSPDKNSKANIEKSLKSVQITEAAFPIKKSELETGSLDYVKITYFVNMLSRNELKKSEALSSSKKAVIEKLKIDALNGNRTAVELLEKLK